MRFTPSATWSLLEGAGSKGLIWKMYARPIDHLSGSLTSGSWTEVTDYVPEFPGAESRIEYEVAEFASNELSIDGMDVQFWRDSVLTTGSAFTEFKVTLDLTDGSKVTTDTPIVFSGFVARDTIEYNELSDRVRFSVFTVQDIGATLPAELISAQYVNTNIDGSGTDGLTLPAIPRLYVKNANITGYVLRPGTHTITYSYESTGSVRQAKLDDGEFVSLVNGDNTLSNSDDTQRVTVYTIDVTQLPRFPDTGTLEDKVLVVSPATLPRNWLRNVSAKSLLRKCYTQLGITTQSYGDLRVATARGGSKLSFVEMVPDDPTAWTNFADAIVSDGTDLWVGIGNKLYKRTMSEDTYALKATLPTGVKIRRLFHASASGYIWAVANGSGTMALRHTISNGVNSSAVWMTGSFDEWSTLVYDTRSSLVYVDNTNGNVREVRSDMTDALVFTSADLGYSGTDGPTAGFIFENNGKIYIQTTEAGTGSFFHAIEYIAGQWEDHGRQNFLGFSYGNIGCFHASESRVYFYDPVDHDIRHHTLTVATVSIADVTGVPLESWEIPESVQYDPGLGRVWYTSEATGKLYEIAGTSGTAVYAGNPMINTRHFGFTSIGSDLFGLSENGLLYKYGPTVELCAGLADFSGLSVRDAYNQVLGAFHLIATIDGKSARVYQRTDASGGFASTGQTASVTIAEGSDITARTLRAYELVRVSNSSGSSTYNGSEWDTGALSTVRTVENRSELISHLILDEIALKLWHFFGEDHPTYTVPLEAYPAVEYAPLDACSLSLGSTKLGVSVTGLIVSTRVDQDGTVTLEVMT